MAQAPLSVAVDDEAVAIESIDDESIDDELAAEASDGCPRLQQSELCTTANPSSRVVREILARVGDKWSLLTIGALHDGPLRFTELQKRIDGISHRMLTQTLRGLERDGLVSRRAYPEIPPRVEYEATPLGRSLGEPVFALVAWAGAHHDEIAAAREAYDGDLEAG